MINVGILGGETDAAGELIRILINHPDVILRSVASREHAGERIDRFHRGLTGDTDLCFSPALDPSRLQCVFITGEPWQAEEFLASVANVPAHKGEEEDDDDNTLLRIIDLTGYGRNGAGGMVYGFAEHRRKALVRGALRAAIPSATAQLLELALFPLVKNHMLRGDVDVTLTLPRRRDNLRNDPRDTTGADLRSAVDGFKCGSGMGDATLSTRLDPIAPAENRPDCDKAAGEAACELRAVDPTFNGRIQIREGADPDLQRGLTARISLPLTANIDELRAIYDEAYGDHAFAYSVDFLPAVADVANTNKCLIHLSAGADPQTITPAANTLGITAVMDELVKGTAGTAVHCLNLLFGLQERTGLALKASAR